ncbi:MAG: NUDIX domain-containing protein [Candidatus Brocadiae bacterium]|nr:NUDIX domain-containing protein [Candidatus Brocadiia bacterium]
MKKSVGIILLYQGKALLQRRGDWDWEKDQFQSFRGAYQVTAHGKCEESETWEESLIREIKEELGEKIKGILQPSRFTLIKESKKTGKISRTYALLEPLTLSEIRLIMLEPSSGSLYPFPLKELEKIQILDPSQKDTQFSPFFMFADEKEALEVVWNLINKQ